jgi:hypothetical protein
MTKKSKMIKLIALVLVLIAVIGAYFVVEKMNKEKQEKELIKSTSEESKAIAIPSVDTDKVASFSYSFDGVEYQFKKENDTWYCSNDESQLLDQDKLNQLVANFKNVTVSRVVEDSATDLSQYGFDNPTNTINVVDTDGNTTTYQIGNKNDVADGYYIKMGDSNEVYLISSFPDEFSKTLNDLIKTEDTTKDATTTTDSTTSTDTTTQD